MDERTRDLSIANETLAHREAFLDSVIENAGNAIFVLEYSAEGQSSFIHVNRAGKALYGLGEKNKSPATSSRT